MKIKMISYPCWDRLSSKQRELRIKTASTILNDDDADFVMFSEHIFNSKEDLDAVCRSVNNNKITALFELKLAKGLIGNQLFFLHNGNIIDLQTHQVFMDHKCATADNIEKLIDELEQHRQFEVNGKRFLIIQCGENNILKTQKKAKDKAEFRLQNRDLKKRFDTVLDNVDVVLNPVHTKWGRFYDLTCRLYKFSENHRYCFYCTQLEDNMLENAIQHPEKNTAQRVYHSRRLLSPIKYPDNNKDYLLQVYEI